MRAAGTLKRVSKSEVFPAELVCGGREDDTRGPRPVDLAAGNRYPDPMIRSAFALLCISAVVACGDDDTAEAGGLDSTAFVGTWDVTAYEETGSISIDGEPEIGYVRTGSNFDATYTFDENGRFTPAGRYDEIEVYDGDTDTFSTSFLLGGSWFTEGDEFFIVSAGGNFVSLDTTGYRVDIQSSGDRLELTTDVDDSYRSFTGSNVVDKGDRLIVLEK